MKNDVLVKMFFTPDADYPEEVQRCICGKVHQKLNFTSIRIIPLFQSLAYVPGGGFTSLLNHIKKLHKEDWEETVLMAVDNEEPYQLKISDCMGVMVSSHAKKIFAWLELIIMKDLPISFCEDEIFVKYCSYDKV